MPLAAPAASGRRLGCGNWSRVSLSSALSTLGVRAGCLVSSCLPAVDAGDLAAVLPGRTTAVVLDGVTVFSRKDEARAGTRPDWAAAPDTRACRKWRHDGKRSSGSFASARATQGRSASGSAARSGSPLRCASIT